MVTQTDQLAEIIPLRKLFIGREFWTAWHRMERENQDAYLLGEIRNLDHRLSSLEVKVLELQERLEEAGIE